MKKKLPVVILSAALGMTMIPATCMAAEFNSGDTKRTDCGGPGTEFRRKQYKGFPKVRNTMDRI